MTAPHTRTFEQRSAGDRDGTFESALRGYDRRQVDEKLAFLQAELSSAKSAKQQAADELQQARERAERAEQQLKETREEVERLSQQPGSEQSAGFGARAERLIRMAENEAAEARAAAATDAAALVDEARGEAEAHRHQVEQDLINKSAQQEQEAARRTAMLKEREQEIANERSAARQETEELRESAKREAARLLQEAEAKAADARRQAEKFAEQQRDAALREVDRLTGMRHGVRSELARLHEYLGTELAEDEDEDGSTTDDDATA